MQIFHAAQNIVQKLRNEQSAKVICRFDKLRTSNRKRQRSHMRNEKVIINLPI